MDGADDALVLAEDLEEVAARDAREDHGADGDGPEEEEDGQALPGVDEGHAHEDEGEGEARDADPEVDGGAGAHAARGDVDRGEDHPEEVGVNFLLDGQKVHAGAALEDDL